MDEKKLPVMLNAHVKEESHNVYCLNPIGQL